MERHVVVGTAGHIDHGKTALVKALTGVDTDRLAEEKARGITIELGFAPLALDGLRASVVDVPGHEAFVRNMVAGATGVDLALLVVAADEGVMPQTREHLSILRFLGVRRGVVALTKCDLTPDPAWRDLVREEVRSLIAGELGKPWPVVEVSAVTGEGVGALRAELSAAAAGVGTREADDRFRLPVDRVFTLAGAGTIVTGTAWSGAVAVGEKVLVLPAGREARVRSIQVHGSAAMRAEPGRRTALALVGISKEEVARGDVVVSGGGWRAGLRFDAELSLLPGVQLRSRARLRVHHGTAEAMARVSALGEPAGDTRAARLVLEAPLVLRAGDRLVLRSFSPVATIGGGLVADPWVDQLPRLTRRTTLGRVPARLPADDSERVGLMVRRRGNLGMNRQALEVAAGLSPSRLAAVLNRAQGVGVVEREGWLFALEEVALAARRLEAALDGFHREHPLEPGMPAQAWRAQAGAGRGELVDLAVARLTDSGSVVLAVGLVRRPSFDAAASDDARAAQERLLAHLARAGAEPPSVVELKAAFPELDVPSVLRLLARSGSVVQVAPDRFYEAGALARERDRLLEALRRLGPATPAVLREQLGRSRKWLIPLLEWADRQGLTSRQGDQRVLRVQAGS